MQIELMLPTARKFSFSNFDLDFEPKWMVIMLCLCDIRYTGRAIRFLDCFADISRYANAVDL
jgi:hypothetical protein